MASPSKRIPVNGPQGGLNAAFAGLQIDGLPEGDALPQIDALPQCHGESEQPGRPDPNRSLAPSKPGRVVLRREKAHRGGKTVLVVDGFAVQHSQDAIESLGKRLRAACGCGGTVRGRTLEIQGDQPARVRSFLEQEGFQVAGEK